MKRKSLILRPLSLSLFAYSASTDYQRLINEAAAAGDYRAAAVYEQQRNEKIAREGLNYQQTHNYSQYFNEYSDPYYDDPYADPYSGRYDPRYDDPYYDDPYADPYSGRYDPRVDGPREEEYNPYYDDPYYDEPYYDEPYYNDPREEQYDPDMRVDQYDLDSILEQIDSAIGPAPTYSSEWDDTKDRLAQAALDMRYENWTGGDQYKDLEERYSRQGKMSMQDLLGQIASRTGGLASSYAATAANQEYNDWMAQLEEAARQMYANARGDAIQKAQMAYDAADREYQRYLDRMAQYNGKRNYAMQALSESLAQNNYNREWQNTLAQQDYNRRMADREWQNTLAQQDYNRRMASRGEAQQRIDTYLAAGGSAANLNPSLIRDSGYSPAELAAQERYYNAQNAQYTPAPRNPAPRTPAPKPKPAPSPAPKKTAADIRKEVMGYKQKDGAKVESIINNYVNAGVLGQDQAADLWLEFLSKNSLRDLDRLKKIHSYGR